MRVRLQDDRGVLRTHTQTFENYDDAILWRDGKCSQVRLGESGEKLERRRILQSITLGDLIRRYRNSPRFFLKRSSTNEAIILDEFARAEANGLCKKSLADLKRQRVLWVTGIAGFTGLNLSNQQPCAESSTLFGTC